MMFKQRWKKSGRHEEAIEEIEKARDLDPLGPRIAANVGNILYFARRYDQALDELKKAVELYPEHAINYGYMAKIYTDPTRVSKRPASLSSATSKS